MALKKLAWTNLERHAGRTFGLMAIVGLLAFVLCGGALVVNSLQNGLASLEARLGADIIVGPVSAKSKVDFDEVLLDGVPGSFYMDKSIVAKVAAREGVEIASPQYYLATMKASCCAMPVQIIGYDPDTDFTVKPWITRTIGGDMGLFDVVVGSQIGGAVGSVITFYGQACTIVGKMDETGTSLDNAVYANNETVKALVLAAEALGFAPTAHEDPDEVVSLVMVKVADGYNVDDVYADIVLHVRGITAAKTRTMTSGVADSVAAMSGVIRSVYVVIAVLALAVLVVAFLVVGKQRTREFAVLRVAGASRRSLAELVMKESAIISICGAIFGVLVALIIIFLFNNTLESALGLPFLLPQVATVVLYAVLTIIVSVVAGCAASAISGQRLSRVEPGQILREE